MDVKDYERLRGDTISFDAFAKTPDPTTGLLVPVDLTGGKAWFTAKRTISDNDENALIRLSTSIGGVSIVNAAGGQVRVTIDPSKTSSLPDDPVSLLYDVQVRDAAGNVTTAQRGTLRIDPDVTRLTT